eukprot:Skav227484  [mRNA]  locus=scaffold2491:586935:588569:+ [translate_table: standard]
MELQLFLWTLFGIAHGLEMQPETPPIRVKQGLLQGRRETRCEAISYLGVPFAEPPVETLRFRPPVMHRGWPGTYTAVKRRLPCWQPEKMKAMMRVQNFSEDCLYMNIHAPIPGPSRSSRELLRPVLFNIHGGAFNTLWAVTGEKLAAAADAVFVAPQYRLGVLGFLATESPPPNLGIQDQVLALQWVRENIHNFGGDPQQVMIFGGSGGGAAVAAHLTMPSSWGLFQAAGMDSPGGHQGWHAAEDPRVRQGDDFMLTSLSLKDSLDYAHSLGCEDANDLSCLQGFDPEFLIQHATISPISRQKRWFFSAAAVQGDFPLALIARGAWHRVPLIVGISSCEACKLATLQSGPVGTNLTREEFREDMSRWGFSGRGSSQITPDHLELWYASRIESEGYWRTVARIIADSAWACQGVLHAEAAVVSGGLESGVYMYYLNYTSPGYPYPGGLHGYIAQWYMQRPWRPSAGERTLMSSLAHYWANLARNGTPNARDLPHWPVFDPQEENNVMILDVPMFAGTSLDVRRSECQHWKPYLGWADDVTVTPGS